MPDRLFVALQEQRLIEEGVASLDLDCFSAETYPNTTKAKIGRKAAANRVAD